jgi:hypothetical protein
VAEHQRLFGCDEAVVVFVDAMRLDVAQRLLVALQRPAEQFEFAAAHRIAALVMQLPVGLLQQKLECGEGLDIAPAAFRRRRCHTCPKRCGPQSECDRSSARSTSCCAARTSSMQSMGSSGPTLCWVTLPGEISRT